MSNGCKTNTHLTGLEGKMPEKELGAAHSSTQNDVNSPVCEVVLL